MAEKKHQVSSWLLRPCFTILCEFRVHAHVFKQKPSSRGSLSAIALYHMPSLLVCVRSNFLLIGSLRLSTAFAIVRTLSRTFVSIFRLFADVVATAPKADILSHGLNIIHAFLLRAAVVICPILDLSSQVSIPPMPSVSSLTFSSSPIMCAHKRVIIPCSQPLGVVNASEPLRQTVP